MSRLSTCKECGAKYSSSTRFRLCPACARNYNQELKREERDRKQASAARSAAIAAERQAAAAAAAAARAERERIQRELEESQRKSRRNDEITRLKRLAGVSVAAPAVQADTKECPQCAEEVKIKAKICRFCRYEFPDVASDQANRELEEAMGTVGAFLKLAPECDNLFELAWKADVAFHEGEADHGREVAQALKQHSSQHATLAQMVPVLQALPEAERLRLAEPDSSALMDLSNTATVVVLGTVRGGLQMNTSLKLDFARPGTPAQRFAPIMLAGEGTTGASNGACIITSMVPPGRSGAFNTDQTIDVSCPMGGESEDFHMEALVPAGTLVLGFRCFRNEASGSQECPKGSRGVVQVDLAPGQTLVLDVGPVVTALVVAGKDFGWFGPGKISKDHRFEPKARLLPADLDAHKARWMTTQGRAFWGQFNKSNYDGDWAKVKKSLAGMYAVYGEGEQPSGSIAGGEPVDGMRFTMGFAARSVWGEATPQAGGFLGNAVVNAAQNQAEAQERARKQKVVDEAKAVITRFIESGEQGLCPAIDRQLARRNELVAAVDEAEAARDQAKAAKERWGQLVARAQETRKAANLAEAPIKAFATRLGTAAHEAMATGVSVPGTEKLAELEAEIDRLKGEHQELDKVTGFFAKAKATAQQLALTAQINIAEGKVKTTRKDVGLALLQAGNEADVPGSEALVGEIAEARAAAAQALVDADAAEAEREDAKPELMAALGITEWNDGAPAKVVNERIAAASAAVTIRDGWLKTATDAVLADKDGWPEDGPVRDALDDHAEKASLL